MNFLTEEASAALRRLGNSSSLGRNHQHQASLLRRHWFIFSGFCIFLGITLILSPVKDSITSNTIRSSTDNTIYYVRPRAFGKILESNINVFATDASGVVKDGTYWPKGRWCRQSPSCLKCTEYCPPSCYVTPQKIKGKRCRLLCQDRAAPSGSSNTPMLYSLVLSLSTAYLIIQLKMLFILWAPKAFDSLLTFTTDSYEIDCKIVQSSAIATTTRTTIIYYQLFNNKNPEVLNCLVLDFLDFKSLVTMTRVSRVWKDAGCCNRVWKTLVAADFPKFRVKPNCTDFMTMYQTCFTKKVARKNVKQYEQKHLMWEGHYVNEIQTLGDMNGIRQVATSILVTSLVSQNLVLVITILHGLCLFLTLLSLISMLCLPLKILVSEEFNFYRMVPTNYRNFIRQGLNVVMLAAAILCLVAYYAAPAAEFEDNVSSSSASTTTRTVFYSSSPSSSFIAEAGYTALRILPVGLFVASVIKFSRRISIKDAMLVASSATLILLIEMIYFHTGITTPTLGLLCKSSVPVLIFGARFFLWMHVCVTIALLEPENTSIQYRVKEVGSALYIYASMELALYVVGYPNAILLYVFQLSFITLMIDVTREIIVLMMISRALILLLSVIRNVIMVPHLRTRHLKKLAVKEVRELYKLFGTIAGVEILLALLSSTSVPLSTSTITSFANLKSTANVLKSILDYVHWSRSLTFLCATQIFYSESLPRFRAINRQKHVLTIASIVLCLYDIHGDINDTASAYQPFLSTAWTLVWLLY